MTAEEQTSKERDARSETKRKLVHISFGFMALSLRWLSFPIAAAMGLAAVLFNWLILPRVGGKEIARSDRGWDRGIVLYPIIVLLAIVTFRGPQRWIAGTIWALLAFGDGFASLIGRSFRGAALPWNRKKSLMGMASFIFFGATGAMFVARFLGGSEGALTLGSVILLTTFIAAIAESIDIGIDDNLVVGIVSAATLAWLTAWSVIPSPRLDRVSFSWLVLNLLLAVAGYAGRSVNVSGLLAGLVLGSVLILFGGWQVYVVLLIFFVLGSVSTKVGYKRKAAAGLAQEGGGRRGLSHAFANVGVAAICALTFAALVPHNAIWLVASIAALSTAAADTTSSEIGQLLGKRALLPLTFQRVAVGTEGAISLEGTVAGAAAALITAGSGVVLLAAAGAIPATSMLLVLGGCWLGALLGSYIESVAGSINRRAGKPVSNGALNFFNTAVGAALAVAICAKFLQGRAG